MFGPAPVAGLQKTTSYKVVLPFYAYAALAFLTGCVLLLLHTPVFGLHHFHPYTLAITHVMALGWATMIILGASHQLLPVLTEGALDSEPLAMFSFVATGLGIPLLVAGFYTFQPGWLMQSGAVLVNLGVLAFLINVVSSIIRSGRFDVHACFLGVATVWLFTTTFFGLLLVFNLSRPLLPLDSISYLSLHAHLGLAGWFLLLVMGVATRLIPMFLISKYTNPPLLWWMFALVNSGLLTFIGLFSAGLDGAWYYLPLIMVLAAIVLLGAYCRAAYQARIRKKVDEQVGLSLLSVAQMLLPLVVMMVALALLPTRSGMVMLYGFCVFFGWLTVIILGMTFKTLPFIVWNKEYHDKTHSATAPAPKDLFSEKLFNRMTAAYLLGFVVFVAGILMQQDVLLRSGAALLLLAAVLYVWNVAITFFHRSKA